MTVSLKHAFQSAKADGPDDTVVQPSDWNSEHQLTLASGKLLGRSAAGNGAAEEIAVGSGLSLASGVLSATGGGYTYSPITYTYTGTLDVEPVVILSAPFPSQSGGAVESQTGKWASVLNLLPNPKLTSIEFSDLQGISFIATFSGCSAMTSMSFPALTTAASFSPSTFNALASLSLPVLANVWGSFAPASLPALTTMSLPALVTIAGSFQPNTLAALTSLSLPSLTSIGTNLNPLVVNALTTMSFPALKNIGGVINLNTMTSLTTMSLPAIENIAPALTTGNAIVTASTAALSNFSFGSGLKRVGGTAGNVSFTSCALNQASVDGILVRLAALDGTNGTTAFSNRTVTITGTSAAPSATGLTAKATLVARGCTVTHN